MAHKFIADPAGSCYLCDNARDDAIHTVAFRRWLPAAWLDEVVPECGNSPDDFLRRDTLGVLQLTPINRDEDESWPGIENIVVGQTVEFCWTEDYGRFELAIADDDSWSVGGEIPPTANCFNVDDTIGDSAAEVVRMLLEDEPGAYRGHTVELHAYCWSQGQSFDVRVLESGAARFVPAEQAAA